MLRALIRRMLPPDPHTPSVVRALFSKPYRALRRLEREVRQATDGRVAFGPFTGMRYTWRSLGSMLAPKLLGTYEMELWPALHEIVASDYKLVIDLGAAEGFYAVGLARSLPAARVVAFEAKVDEHDVLLDMANLNDLRGRIEMHGLGTVETLNRVLTPGVRTLVVSDIEGFEADLLDPQAVPALQHADLLVELHDYIRAGISDLLRTRFAATHEVITIHSRDRTLADWPAGVKLPDDSLRLKAMHEGRPGEMDWFWMKAKSKS